MKTQLAPIWKFWLAVIGMFVLGMTLRFASPSYAASLHQEKLNAILEILNGLGEALIIAAILAAIVDPYAKFRLGKEIGREIAKETAGQHLPEKLRCALESIQDIKLYMLHMVINVELEKTALHPGFLKWRTTIHYEVENASWNNLPFVHQVSINDSAADIADGKIIEVAHYWNGKRQYKLEENSRELRRMSRKEESTTFFTHENVRKIASSRLGATEKYEYFNSTERLVSESEVQVIQVALPTVGFVLTVRHPEGVQMHTSLQYIDGILPECPDGEKKGRVLRWNSRRAYLTNEHIWIMYENEKPTPKGVQVRDPERR